MQDPVVDDDTFALLASVVPGSCFVLFAEPLLEAIRIPAGTRKQERDWTALSMSYNVT